MGQQEPRGQSGRAIAHNLTARGWGWKETEQCCGWNSLYIYAKLNTYSDLRAGGIALVTLTSADPTWSLRQLAFLARFTAKGSFDTLRKHAQALVQPCSHI